MNILKTLVFAFTVVGCQSSSENLRPGMEAPDFALEDQDGRVVRLSDFRGNAHVVLFFYPKDDTHGCTREACGFRDSLRQLKDLGAEVLGISVDDVQSHKRFAEKYDLNFALLADPHKEVTQLYGVKGLFGLARRVTFVIDKEGTIAKVFPDVDVNTHSGEIIAFLSGRDK